MGRNAVDKKRNSKRAKTKKWAEELMPKLQEISIASLTIDELAHLMGKSKSTIYQYFKSKEEILAYTVEVRLEQMSDFRTIFRQEPFQPVAQFEAFLKLICKGAQDISPRFLHDLKANYPLAWQQIEIFFLELLQETIHFYETGIQKSYFEPISTNLLARLDHVFIFQIMSDPNSLDENTTLDDLVRDYLLLRFNGIMRR